MIAIVDYGMGNLRSVQKALQRSGGDARIVRTPSELKGAGKIVLPGVGAFRDGIARLRRARLAKPLAEAVGQGVPFLGICLGLQMLFDVSYEDGQHTGLGILPGKVVRFAFEPSQPARRLPVPHMGWNRIFWRRPCPILAGLDSGSFVYFCHSYHVVPVNQELTLTRTEYGYEFTSSIWHENVFATQCHPEKSQAVGLKILENFVRL